jgi:hypothetical protein
MEGLPESEVGLVISYSYLSKEEGERASEGWSRGAKIGRVPSFWQSIIRTQVLTGTSRSPLFQSPTLRRKT